MEMSELTTLITLYMEYVRGLEERSVDYEYSECTVEYFDISSFFDVPPVRVLYRPDITYVKKGKCSKCNKNRMILKESAVYNEYNMCSCFTDGIKVSVLSCPIVLFKNGYYVLLDGSSVCADSVVNGDIDFRGYDVFFDNEADCVAYCNKF